jgi:protein-S-isoprenylcysteine O-methyltransferase Ste14
MIKAAVSKSELARMGRWVFPRRLATGLVAVVVAGAFVRPVSLTAVHGMVSVLLIGMGLGLRAWAAACAGGHTREASISAPRLVTDGPYGHVRNPIYLGTVILGIGMVWLIGDPRMIPLLLGACVMLYATIIPAEEQFLAKKFGAEFEKYRQAVPQLIPRWRAWMKTNQRRPVWANARGDLAIGGLLGVIYGFLRISAWLRD